MLQHLFSKHKNKIFAFSVTALALGISSLVVPLNGTEMRENHIQSEQNPSVITASEGSSDSVDESESEEEHETGDFYISPNIDEMHWADMQVFTSYEQTSSGAIAVNSEWSVSANYRSELYGCEGETSTCTVFTDVGNESFTLSADRGEDGDELEIDYSFLVENTFTDELPEWAEVQVISFANRGIINGYDDGSYGPNDDVTRGQFVLLIDRLAEFKGYDLSFATDGKDCDLYDDVTSDHYAYDAVCTAHYLNWIEGITFGDDFGVDTVLDRGMAAQFTYNSLGEFIAIKQYGSTDTLIENLRDENDYRSEDINDVATSHEYFDAIMVLDHLGIMTGDGVSFNPNGDVNRAQAAVVLWRTKYLMEYFVD